MPKHPAKNDWLAVAFDGLHRKESHEGLGDGQSHRTPRDDVMGRRGSICLASPRVAHPRVRWIVTERHRSFFGGTSEHIEKYRS